MLYTTPPTRLAIPFANAGGKNTVPDASQIGVTDGAASFTDGFPPLTRTRIDQGGIPPNGLDMNGVLYQMSAPVRYLQAGGGYTYDATFAAAIGGYPKGARLLGSNGASFWKAGADSITSNPESAGSASAGWVPGFVNSGVSINLTSVGDFSLSPIQYNNSLIVFTGTLIETRIITFPTIMSAEWTIQCDVTGDDILVKTASGSGVTITPGGRLKVYCDGTNIKSSVLTAGESPQLSIVSSRPISSELASSIFFRKTGGVVTGAMSVNGLLNADAGVVAGSGIQASGDVHSTDTSGKMIRMRVQDAGKTVSLVGSGATGQSWNKLVEQSYDGAGSPTATTIGTKARLTEAPDRTIPRAVADIETVNSLAQGIVDLKVQNIGNAADVTILGTTAIITGRIHPGDIPASGATFAISWAGYGVAYADDLYHVFVQVEGSNGGVTTAVPGSRTPTGCNINVYEASPETQDIYISFMVVGKKA